jgi:hypothetical protein
MVSVHFYTAKSFVGRVVQFFLRGTYVHCAIQVDGKHIIETDAFKRVSLCHLYQVPDKVVWVDVEVKDVMTRFNEIMNAPYDYGGALALIGIGKQCAALPTCVELATFLLKVDCGNIKPDQLYQVLQNFKRLGMDNDY